MNRNHFLIIGLVVLALGIQIHIVDSYVLSEKATQTLAKIKGKDAEIKAQSASLFFPSSGPAALGKKEVETPRWLGWLLMSVGSVLVLHAFSMPKPSG